MSSSPDYSLAAYTERDSIDPLTCEEGKLRQEWAVVSAHPFPSDLAELHFPSIHRDWNEYALIHRYIKRGQVYPWTLVDYYGTEEEALRDILDTGVVAVDIRLVTIQREREWARRTEEARLAVESEKARERDANRLRAAQGAKAFFKLWTKGEGTPDRALCEQWTAFVQDPYRVAHRDLYAADPTFMSLYYAALYADRLPTKRKAMREFFAHVEARYPGALDAESTPASSPASTPESEPTDTNAPGKEA